jgi:hypothetical protein
VLIARIGALLRRHGWGRPAPQTQEPTPDQYTFSGREIDFPDSATYGRYKKSGGTLAKDDWRRHVASPIAETGKSRHT